MSSATSRWTGLAPRIATGAALAGAALVSLLAGGMLFWLLCVTLSLLMMGEWADLERVGPRLKRIGQFALAVPLALMAPVASGPSFFSLGALAGAAFFTVIVTRRQRLAAGVIYAGLPVLAVLLIRRQHEGIGWTVWALALVWVLDIGAFFVGRAVGGAKLAPRISPGKTWAGLVGGTLLASAFGAFMHWRFGLPMRMTAATPLLALVAQAGDLYESWLKRRAGVKDSGVILPGHGGVMDRLDGLVPVAPIAALLVVLPKFYHVPLAWHA